MKKTLLIFKILIFIISIHASEHVPGEILVKFHANISRTTRQIFLETNNFDEENLISQRLNIYLYSFNNRSVSEEDMLEIVRRDPSVQYAQLNFILTLREGIEEISSERTSTTNTFPNDPRFSDQWSLNNTGQTGGTPGTDIKALAAWENAYSQPNRNSREIVVAILDSGFLLSHPDLNFWKNVHETSTPNGLDTDGNGYIDDYHGWNGNNNNGNITSTAHGTHVSGIVASIGDNGEGIAPIAHGAKIMPVQLTVYQSDPQFNLSVSRALTSYNYVLQNRLLYNETNGAYGSYVVATNASWGLDRRKPHEAPVWEEMYNALGEAGVLSTAAPPNQNWNIDVEGDLPTAFPSPYLISVTNTNHNDLKYSPAAWGLETIDMAAPGTSILSTTTGQIPYTTGTGTSFAAPHVAGVIALMYQTASEELLEYYRYNPGDLALLFRTFILDGVDPIPAMQGITVTGGRLNALNAVLSVIELNNELKYSPPSLINTEKYDESVILTWHIPPVQDLTGFKVYRNGIAISDIIYSTRFIDSNISNNTDYNYHITSIFGAIESRASNIVNLTTLFPINNLNAIQYGYTVHLQWQGANGLYNIYRNNQIIGSTTDKNFIDTNTIPGEIYTYSVVIDYVNNKSIPVSKTVIIPIF